MKAASVTVVQKNHVIAGLSGLLFVGLAHYVSLNQSLTQVISPFTWQVTSGVILFAIMLFQWALFYYKIVKNMGAVRTHTMLHRYAGIGAVLIFAVHTVSAGYAWSLLLFVAFLGVAVTGLLNRGIVRFNRNSMHKLWLWVHISLAGVLMPLSILHMYVALAFE